MYKTTTRGFAWMGILGALVACGGDPTGPSNNAVGGNGEQGQSGGARASGGTTQTAGTSSGLGATGGGIASAGTAGITHPEKVYPGLQAASFIGPAGVGAMSDPQYQQFVDDAYASVATLQLTAGTIYYQKSWTALSLLMLTGNFVNFAAL